MCAHFFPVFSFWVVVLLEKEGFVCESGHHRWHQNIKVVFSFLVFTIYTCYSCCHCCWDTDGWMNFERITFQSAIIREPIIILHSIFWMSNIDNEDNDGVYMLTEGAGRTNVFSIQHNIKRMTIMINQWSNRNAQNLIEQNTSYLSSLIYLCVSKEQQHHQQHRFEIKTMKNVGWVRMGSTAFCV